MTELSKQARQEGMPGEFIEDLECHLDAARTMLKALIAIAHDLNTPIALRGMAFAVIAQAEKAGITTGEDNG